MYQCDDGNTRDGDGCSSQCKVEEFYECKGGDENNADMCVYKKRPEIVQIKITSNMTLSIIFSTNLIKYDGKFEDAFIFEHVNARGELTEIDWEYQEIPKKRFKKVYINLIPKFSVLRNDVFLIFIIKK